MTRIVVDAMGSDKYPTPDVEGAVMAAREYGVEILLVGDTAKIQSVLNSVENSASPIGRVFTEESVAKQSAKMNSFQVVTNA